MARPYEHAFCVYRRVPKTPNFHINYVFCMTYISVFHARMTISLSSTVRLLQWFRVVTTVVTKVVWFMYVSTGGIIKYCEVR